MLTQTKRLFQLSLITVFASMLVLGAAATASADHDDLDIKVTIKEECHNGTDKPIKRTIKSTGSMPVRPVGGNLVGKNGGTNLSPFPGFTVDFFIIDDFF